MSLIIPVTNKNLISKEFRKKLIVKILIEKIFKIKNENKYINCIPFYDFIFYKYARCFSLEDCFKLFFLQNIDFCFNMKLIRHICTTINNSSIFNILMFKNEFIINHIYKCNILKYKCYFINEYYNFIYNILLLCSINLCSPNIFKRIYDQQKQMKLKNLNNFYNHNKYIILYNLKNENNKIRDINLFIKLYKCFSSNNIYPFSFLNKYFYYSFYISPFKIITRNIIYNNIFNGKSCFSFNLELYKNITYLKFHEICQVLFYLSKGNLFFYYESFLNTYFYILVNYIFNLIYNNFNNIFTCLNVENNFIKKEENIDNLIMSFINYLSSSYIIKNISKKIPSVLLCIYIFSTLFHLLYKYQFPYFNLTNFSKINNNSINFILLNQKDIYLSNLSFIKKYILLLYIINDLLPLIRSKVIYNKEKYNEQINKITIEFERSVLQNNIKKNKLESQCSVNYINQDKMDDKCHTDKIEISENFINKNVKLFLNELFSKKKKNIFNYVQLPFLKLLYYKIFIYSTYNKNEDFINRKKSALEKEIFQEIQNYICKKNSNYICLNNNSNGNIFFTVDIEIYKKKK
ncbi:conserved Plasmodium protein, unknown function [Plasmodium gallinaceum]|uniref:Uncharacterized protein n=1 Tax=Plasmodium gallinaceum TaxID=5849 RepID=A0A1J1H008_PLAGA|nr:conserved Plasmodium protein, unknown function [Plasmodium gallinaceum]CRG98036.1 conserved Plasmodium protein, unknown function [Plasmodium gallinaceum]